MIDWLTRNENRCGVLVVITHEQDELSELSVRFENCVPANKKYNNVSSF